MGLLKSFIKYFLISIILSMIVSLIFGFTKTNILDYFFGFSLFIFIANIFRYISNEGAYDFIGYSFYRSKKYFRIFSFFKDNEDEEYMDLNDYLNSKEKKYSNVNISIISSTILLIIASILNIRLYF